MSRYTYTITLDSEFDGAMVSLFSEDQETPLVEATGDTPNKALAALFNLITVHLDFDDTLPTLPSQTIDFDGNRWWLDEAYNLWHAPITEDGSIDGQNVSDSEHVTNAIRLAASALLTAMTTKDTTTP